MPLIVLDSMNLRIFDRDDDLRSALHQSLLRIIDDALRPHIGVVGRADEAGWLLERLEGDRRVRVVGHPASLHDPISTSANLSPAEQEDLLEPLDLCVVLGSRIDPLPPWYENARAIWVVPLDRERFEEWQAVNDGTDPWFFIPDSHRNRADDDFRSGHRESERGESVTQ